MTTLDIHESKCDVLIVGAGPAGLMMATWMARCGINARIVDKRGTKIYAGQADGLQIRSLEIFDSFGFADRVVKEANHMIEVRKLREEAYLFQYYPMNSRIMGSR
jgi:2-polyprenyl-6-methoxyphenol hydroxylase-like FAD-dependent oxidoreductase